MVVESAAVNHVPTAVEVIREMDERVTAVQQGGLVFELLHPDACGGKPGKGCYLPSGLAVTAWEPVRGGRGKQRGCSETSCYGPCPVGRGSDSQTQSPVLFSGF